MFVYFYVIKHPRFANIKDSYNIEHEVVRLFDTREDLYEDIEAYLGLFDLCYAINPNEGMGFFFLSVHILGSTHEIYQSPF